MGSRPVKEISMVSFVLSTGWPRFFPEHGLRVEGRLCFRRSLPENQGKQVSDPPSLSLFCDQITLKSFCPFPGKAQSWGLESAWLPCALKDEQTPKSMYVASTRSWLPSWRPWTLLTSATRYFPIRSLWTQRSDLDCLCFGSLSACVSQLCQEPCMLLISWLKRYRMVLWWNSTKIIASSPRFVFHCSLPVFLGGPVLHLVHNLTFAAEGRDTCSRNLVPCLALCGSSYSGRSHPEAVLLLDWGSWISGTYSLPVTIDSIAYHVGMTLLYLPCRIIISRSQVSLDFSPWLESTRLSSLWVYPLTWVNHLW